MSLTMMVPDRRTVNDSIRIRRIFADHISSDDTLYSIDIGSALSIDSWEWMGP